MTQNSIFLKRLLAPLVVILILFLNLNAQPGRPDVTFNPNDLGFWNGDGPNSYVSKASLQADGKIILTGNFGTFNGVQGRVARVNTDGSFDNSFQPGTGPDNEVTLTAVQPDNKIIIAGPFQTVNGTTRNCIARLNSDGSLDGSFSSGLGSLASDYIYAMALQNDGKVIISGNFSSYDGIARNGIARLNSNGTLDTAFDPGIVANGTIWTLAVQNDGKIIIGGDFTSVDGTTRVRLARLNSNGSLDAGFNLGTGADNIILQSAIQGDGKILIAGDFAEYNGVSRNRFLRLNTDGTTDNAFTSGTGPNGRILSMVPLTNGKVIIVGEFTTYNGITMRRLARLNEDGSLDTSFGIGSGFNLTVFASAVQSDGKIVVAGDFSSYNGIARKRIARVNHDGSLDSNFNRSGTGANDQIWATAVQSDGKILIAGDFDSYNGTFRSRIARLNTDGSVDNSFDPGMGVDNTVSAVAIQSDGKILIAGIFLSFNGVSKRRIARLNSDGSIDNSFNPTVDFIATTEIRSIELQSDNKIIIAGTFSSFDGVTRNNIARLNIDGHIDPSFDPGTGANNTIFSTRIQSDGNILAVGAFTSFNGAASNHIARLKPDGTIDASFVPGTGSDSPITKIATQNDGKIVIVGAFNSYNGVSRSRIARLNGDGSIDTSFNPGTGIDITPGDFPFVYTLAIQGNGKIVIGGDFKLFNGTSRNSIARLNADGSLDNVFDPGSGLGGYAFLITLALQADGKIIAGGAFTSYNGIGRNRLVRVLANPGSQAISFNPFAAVTYGDLPIVLNATASSGLAVSYTSSNPSVATINGGLLTIVGAGVTTITASQLGNTAFNPASDVQQVLTVNKAALNATADNKSKTYGDPNPSLTFTYAGFKGIDNATVIDSPPSIATMATLTSNVGTYPITLTDGTDNNYIITNTTGVLTVGKANLTSTADNKTKTYGDANPVLTFLYSGFKGTDDANVIDIQPSISTTAAALSNVGTYPILLTGGTDNNYVIANTSGTLTVDKATLTATADNKTKTYGDANPALTLTYSGFKGTDGASEIDIPPSIATAATSSSDAGTYPIILTGGTDNNYVIANTNGTLTVTAKNQSISFPSVADKTEGAAPFNLSATASSGLIVTYESVNTSKVTLSGNLVTIVAPGIATIRAKQPGNNNFMPAPNVERTFCVRPAKPSILVNNSNPTSPTLTSSTANGNQWFFNGAPITGATGSSLSVTQSGAYTLQVTVEGCVSDISDQQAIVITGDIANGTELHLTIYPNPTNDKLYVSLQGFKQGIEVHIDLNDANGKVVQRQTRRGGEWIEMSLGALANGVYFVIAEQDGKYTQTKVLKHQ